MRDRHAAITARGTRYPIQLMCAALEVSASGYYASVQRASAPPTARAVARARRCVVVRAMFLRCRRRYRTPRLVHELRDAGLQITQKSVAKILREEGLAARRPTSFVCTTDSTHADPIAENLLARRFALAAVPALDHVWVGDMTYVPTRTGWLYLAVLLVLASRRRAVSGRRADAPHGPWRSTQYASHDYRAVLTTHGVVQSMSRCGDCWDSKNSTVHIQRAA